MVLRVLLSLPFSCAGGKPKPFPPRALAYIKRTSPVATMRICYWVFLQHASLLLKDPQCYTDLYVISSSVLVSEMGFFPEQDPTI